MPDADDFQQRRAIRRIAAALAALMCACAAACGSETKPLGAAVTGGSGGAGGDNLFESTTASGPPEADAGGLCGNQIHTLEPNTPNIYFVLDKSGSMAAVEQGSSTRFQLVHTAAVQMVQKLGQRINVGAALFPLAATSAEPCNVGGEVFPMTPGDPVGETLGQTTKVFSAKTQVAPFGGTPTAATLVNLFPTLAALPGKTIVVLATDGGPNCNVNASCGIAECMANIEEQCKPMVNCCAPGQEPGPVDCVDRQASIAAVTALRDAGIHVYVVGISGSEIYGDVLADMALAGGAPQLAPPFYYQVTDLSNLSAVLGAIAGAAISCEFDLVDPPPDKGLTNVYLDAEVLPPNPANGWTWKSDSSIALVGNACQRLKSGDVIQVQIVTGCPTVPTK